MKSFIMQYKRNVQSLTAQRMAHNLIYAYTVYSKIHKL